jgi:hypothetical protein
MRHSIVYLQFSHELVLSFSLLSIAGVLNFDHTSESAGMFFENRDSWLHLHGEARKKSVSEETSQLILISMPLVV